MSGRTGSTARVHSPSAEALVGHALVLLATITGIIGFGLLYDGISQGNVTYLTTGLPLLLIGLWWAGRELARSNVAARARKERKGALASARHDD